MAKKKRREKMDPVLAKFFGNFFPKFYEYVSSYEEAAKMGLNGLSQDEKKALKRLLEDLVSSRYSADDLVEIWRRSPSENWLTNGEQIRALLRATHKRIIHL